MAAEDYGWIARLLHRLALQNLDVATLQYDLEKRLFKPLPDANGRHVFIAGLARAGSTMLLNLFHSTGEFASLTYEDMPFVLAPNLWSRITAGNQKRRGPKERAHGDGVMVSPESPEALEEVFWRTMTRKSYIGQHFLRPMPADNELIEAFRTYVALILRRYNKDRYLSKNNNNVLRLPALHTAFPNSIIAVPFREPLQHSMSLLRQHQRFSSSDTFTRQYMGWLGHHEFGHDHRPFQLGQTEMSKDTTSADYWLARWIDVYSHFLSAGETIPNMLFVSYECLCREPEAIAERLKAKLEIETCLSTEAIRLPRESTVECEQNLLREAQKIYERLQKRAEHW